MERHRQSPRDRRAEKRRDLARSTCSPLGSVAKNARQAKRNANRRERRSADRCFEDDAQATLPVP